MYRSFALRFIIFVIFCTVLHIISTPFQDVSHQGIMEDWYPLKKMGEAHHKVGKDVRQEKERGLLHVSASVSSTAAQLGKKDSRSYDCLLAHLIHHHVAATNNNNEVHWSFVHT